MMTQLQQRQPQQPLPQEQQNVLYLYRLSMDERLDYVWIVFLLLCELLLGYLIITYIPYTEIDWIAYMEEIQMILEQGEFDYYKIYGNTGPLVYPAGFVYLFGFLRWITNHGQNIVLAQYIFLGFYCMMQMCIFILFLQPIRSIQKKYNDDIYQLHQQQKQQQQQMKNKEETEQVQEGHRPTNKNLVDDDRDRRMLVLYYYLVEIWVWRIGMIVLCCSKRIHSIFLLRLFNDGPTMMMFYLAVYCFVYHQYWDVGCLFFSIAVSIKMNILLFAPGLLLLLLQVGPNLYQVIYRLIVYCAIPQILFGAPFLLTYPISYLRKAFELDRSFFYQWTVNWKFLSESIFLSKALSILLLLLHISGLVVFAFFWLRQANQETGRFIFLIHNTTIHQSSQPIQSKKGLRIATDDHYYYNDDDNAPTEKKKSSSTSSSSSSFSSKTSTPTVQLSAHYIVYTLLVSNFIGIAFARTLHYQFYTWYFHGVVYVLWSPSFSSTTLLLSSSSSSTHPHSISKIVISTLIKLLFRCMVLMMIEFAFLKFPATATSSAILQLGHLFVLCQIKVPTNILETTNGSATTSSSATITTTMDGIIGNDDTKTNNKKNQ